MLSKERDSLLNEKNYLFERVNSTYLPTSARFLTKMNMHSSQETTVSDLNDDDTRRDASMNSFFEKKITSINKEFSNSFVTNKLFIEEDTCKNIEKNTTKISNESKELVIKDMNHSDINSENFETDFLTQKTILKKVTNFSSKLVSGDRYEGDLLNDLMHGKGTYFWLDGRRYEGEWKDGKMHGRGKFYWPSKNWYDGEFENGEKNGRGIYYYSDGSRYEGDFKHDFFNGKGIFFYDNGRRYEGEWQNDRIVGDGKYY